MKVNRVWIDGEHRVSILLTKEEGEAVLTSVSPYKYRGVVSTILFDRLKEQMK